MLKWIAQNKYKLMVFIIGLYLLLDILQHKGQVRVLFPKEFSGSQYQVIPYRNMSDLTRKGKNWIKGVNTKEQLNKLDQEVAGFECDVYFDTVSKSFDVHHDADKSIGYGLNELLQTYQQRNLQASIWLDIKSLDQSNDTLALQNLISLRDKYKLQNKILVESSHAEVLASFCDNGFFTSYYVPFFNPYKISNDKMKVWADSIASVISKAKVDALSGYYFQSSFLNHYFPKYPVLTWIDNADFSLVNALFQRKINSNRSIFIVLKP
jgi:heptose-I-phosphate ethanolaminephosphotransferase